MALAIFLALGLFNPVYGAISQSSDNIKSEANEKIETTKTEATTASTASTASKSDLGNSAGSAQPASPSAINLLSAGDFVVLSKTGITNTGSHNSAITGDIGSSPITAAAMNNVFCSEITGTIYGVDAAYVGSGIQTCFAGNPPVSNMVKVNNAVLDMQTAYNDAAGRTNPTATELGAGNISGMTLAGGLYKWSTSVLATSDVTLSGSANDVWIFQIAGDLNIASGGSVVSAPKILLAGGAQARNIFWQVGGVTGATIGTYATFNGNILTAKQIILETGAIMNGRALAQTQVTLDANRISTPGNVVPPPPSTSCAIPNTLGDKTTERIIPSDEMSLQDMLKQANFDVDVQADQKNYQLWDSGTNDIILKAQFIGGVTKLNSVFGYYSKTDLKTFVPLFRIGESAEYPTAPEFRPGQSLSFSVTKDTSFGFAILTRFPTDQPVYFDATERSQNDSEYKQVLTYNSNNSFILAFEDARLAYSDSDYNDVVVSIKIADCNAVTSQRNTPPVLTLIGSDSMALTVNDTFTDPGATATDAQDGDLTSSIQRTGTVDMSAAGTYTLTYTVTDHEGLTDSKVRTVIVSAVNGNGNGNNHGNGRGGRRGSSGSNGNSNGQVLGASTGPNDCLYLKSFMNINWNNDSMEVLKLQNFLMNNENFTDITLNGIFDTQTFNTVSTFQNRYLSDVIEPWGDTTKGFVYILTKKKINELYCVGKEFPLTASETKEIKDFKAGSINP